MAPNAFNKFPNALSLGTSATAPEVCMPTHADPALSALAMVANFDAQDLNNEESLIDQETCFWSPHEHLQQSSITHKLLACPSLDDRV